MDYPSVTQSAPPDLVSYKKQHMTDMLSLLQSYVDNRNVTFPVRAGLAANCSELMLLLLQERPTYTLTIWSAEKDFVDYVKLNSLLQQVGTDRFYLDVPKILSEKLKYVWLFNFNLSRRQLYFIWWLAHSSLDFNEWTYIFILFMKTIVAGNIARQIHIFKRLTVQRLK